MLSAARLMPATAPKHRHRTRRSCTWAEAVTRHAPNAVGNDFVCLVLADHTHTMKIGTLPHRSGVGSLRLRILRRAVLHRYGWNTAHPCAHHARQWAHAWPAQRGYTLGHLTSEHCQERAGSSARDGGTSGAGCFTPGGFVPPVSHDVSVVACLAGRCAAVQLFPGMPEWRTPATFFLFLNRARECRGCYRHGCASARSRASMRPPRRVSCPAAHAAAGAHSRAAGCRPAWRRWRYITLACMSLLRAPAHKACKSPILTKRPSGEGAVNCAWEVCVQDAGVCLLQAARSVCAWARVVVRSCIPSVDAASPRSACCMHHTSLIHACTHATSPDHFLYYGQQRSVSRHTLSSPDVAAPELPLVPASAPLLRSPALSLSLSLSHANTRLQVLTPTHARTYTLSPSSTALSHAQSAHTYSLALSPLIPLTGCMLDPSRPIRTRPIRSTAGGAPLQCGRAGCAAAGGYRG